MSQFESHSDSPRPARCGARFDPETTTDHRRKAARDGAERVLARAEFLPPEERRLVEAVYGDGWTIRRVAEVSGVHPRVMSRRINRIVARTLSPEFTFVAARQRSWRGTRRAVGKACVLHGLSQREASRRLGMSLHNVRRQYASIRAMVEELS